MLWDALWDALGACHRVGECLGSASRIPARRELESRRRARPQRVEHDEDEKCARRVVMAQLRSESGGQSDSFMQLHGCYYVKQVVVNVSYIGSVGFHHYSGAP